MEVKRVLQLLVVVVLLLAALNGARAAEIEKYFKEGGNMVLAPKVTPELTNIVWKHKLNLVAEYEQGTGLFYYDIFKGRTTLDITSAQLEITNMTIDHAGTYTLEINNKVHGESYTAKMIKDVPVPSVWVRPVACTHESEFCTLLCEGRTRGGTKVDTTEAEPITYSWRRGEGDWSTSEKELTINKDTADTETFSCKIENPVSMIESRPKENPFYKPPKPIPILGIVLGFLALLAAGAVGVVYKNKDAIMAKFSSSATNNASATNGSPPADKKTGETVPLNDSAEKTEDAGRTTEGGAREVA